MKIDLMFLLLFFLGINITAYSRQSLIVKSTITSLEIEKIKKSEVALAFEVQIVLRNTGTKPMYFFNEEEYPKFNAVSIFANKEEVDKGNILAASYYGDSVDRSEKWSILRNELNVSVPPESLIYLLKPGEAWSLNKILYLGLPTEEYKNSSFPRKESWENIQQLGVIWVKFFADSWALNLEEDKTKFKFAKKLQKRWSKYGYLWIDDIASEPISLDLSLAVIKVGPQP